jgi:phosphonate transport system substrate-binding protein
MQYQAPAQPAPQRAGPSIAATWRMAQTLALVGLMTTGTAQAQAQATETIDVRAGDSFSSIAARFTGQTWRWRQVWHPQLSGLPDPAVVQIGMQFELVTEPAGRRYLRLVGSRPVAATPAAPVTAAAAASPAAKPAAPAAAPAPARALAAAVAAPLVASAAGIAPRGDEPLVIGVLPNIGAAVLQAQYENLRSWFERNAAQTVRVVVPANFKVFFDSTLRGEYDLAVAAPHFARVAQVDRGLVPLVMYEPRIHALFLSTLNDGVRAPAEVRGRTVAFANPSSLVALYGQQWLSQQGLVPGKDFEVRGARTDMGVGRLLLTGEAVAAVMSNGEFRALPQDESSRMKIVESFARIPNFIVMANPRLGAARIARLKAQLKAFMVDREEGAAFVQATGVTGMVDVDESVLRELDPFVVPTRRAMGYGP